MSDNALDWEPGWHKPDSHDAARVASPDPFGDEENAEFKYRTLSWWYAANPLGLVSSSILALISSFRQTGMGIPVFESSNPEHPN